MQAACARLDVRLSRARRARAGRLRRWARLRDGGDDDALDGGRQVVRRQQRLERVQVERGHLAPRPAQRSQHRQRVQRAAAQRHLA